MVSYMYTDEIELEILDIESRYITLPKEQTRKAFETRHEKTNVLVSDMVQHKPGCTATEDG